MDLRSSARLEVVASGVDSRRFVDRGAFDPQARLYYQVYDLHSPPTVFGFSPDGGVPGSEITVRGVGFRSDCNDVLVQAGGVEVPLKVECSFTRVVFKVPQNAMTGHLIVATPAGAAVAGVEEEMYCHGTARHPMSW